MSQKRLKIDGYMLRGVRQALNPLSNRVTFIAIVAGAYPGESKMWLENAHLLTSTVENQSFATDIPDISVAEPELYNGGRRSRGGVLEGGCAPSAEKKNFHQKMVGFGAF